MKLKILSDLWSIKQLASLAFCHENAKVLAAVRDAPPLSAPSANSPSPDGGKLAIFSHKNYADIHRSLKGARCAAHPAARATITWRASDLGRVNDIRFRSYIALLYRT